MAARPIRSMQRARRSRGAGVRRSGSRWPSSSIIGALQPAGHQVAGDRRRHLAAPAGLLDEDRDRDLRVVGRGEADEPRVRLAAAAELGRARTCRPW